MHSEWKKGPLPPNTWNWGAVQTKEFAGTEGFFFADFKGDHACVQPDGRRVEAADIELYNNCIELPPG